MPLTENDADLQPFRRIFAQRLEHLLDVRGYPKKNFGRNTRLATELDIKPANVFKLLNGTLPQLPLLKRIVVLLGTTADYLYGFSDEIDAPLRQSQSDSPEPSAVIAPGQKETPAD